jgi:hypothetical protein
MEADGIVLHVDLMKYYNNGNDMMLLAGNIIKILSTLVSVVFV